MYKKMIKWFKTHKPSDWRYVIIIFLLFQIFQRDIMWFMILSMGFVSYPNEIDYVPIFERAGDKIATAYTTAMTKLYEIGFNLAESFYPHNIWIVKIVSYGLKVIIITLVVCVLVWLVNSIMYERDKKSLKNSANAKTNKG